MGSTAVIAAALTTGGAKAKSLYVAGLDVLKQPGSPGNRYGVPISSIDVTERYPGQVSRMAFSITDPQAEIAVAEGDWVRYHDHDRNLPIFTGWVDTWAPTPAYGGQGRDIAVTCIGVEAVLDWTIVPQDIAFGPARSLGEVIQALCAIATGTGELRALVGPGLSSIAGPISNNVALTFISSIASPFTVTAGTTLREAIRAACALGVQPPIVGFPYPFIPMVTVDFWHGLRAEFTGGNGDLIGYDDRAVLTLSTAAGQRGANLNYRNDGGTVRSVFVKGANAAGTGLVSDGSGVIGPVATLSDQSSDSAAALLAVGRAYLTQRVARIRGTVSAEQVDPADYNTAGDFYRPGCQLALTDAAVGASGTYMTTELRKRFYGDGTEDWHVSFGGIPPTASQLIRRFTREARA